MSQCLIRLIYWKEYTPFKQIVCLLKSYAADFVKMVTLIGSPGFQNDIVGQTTEQRGGP